MRIHCRDLIAAVFFSALGAWAVKECSSYDPRRPRLFEIIRLVVLVGALCIVSYAGFASR